MTFAIAETEQPLLAELLSLAFEAAGHDCVVFKSLDQMTRMLDEFHLDSIVVELHVSGRSGLEWLENAATTRRDLPSRTLLLAGPGVTTEEAARIRALGVDVAPKPRSVDDVGRVVLESVRKAQCERART